MKIEKLPSGTYRVRKMNKGRTYTLLFESKPSKSDAENRFKEIIRKDDAAYAVARGSFEHYANEYVRNRSNVLSPSSIVTYERLIKAMSDGFKATDMFEVDQVKVQAEINTYAEKHSPKSVRSLHGFIASVLGVYKPQLVLRTTLPQSIKTDRYLPSEDDIRALLEHTKDTEDHIAIQLGILSLRRSEIAALELSDLSGNELHVHANLVYNKKWIKKESPKTDAGNRVIYLPDTLVQEINEKGYFYKYSPNKMLEHLHKYQKELGLPPFRFHDLRHFFASYASTIMSEADAMALGGWESPHIFKRIYRESMKDKRKKSANKFNDDLFS